MSSLTVHAIASGSSGNSLLVRGEQGGAATSLLIDAGITAAALEKGLARHGVAPGELGGIVITHEHIDHCRAAHTLARKFGVPLIANGRTLSAVIGGKKEVPHALLATGDAAGVGALRVETFPVPHDAVDPVGVSITCGEHKVTPAMRQAARGADLLILEANHDVYRLKAGPYPDALKRRILSDRGHLSNEAAAALLVDHLLDSGPCSIWLAHLSKENNLPKLAYNYAHATLKAAVNCPFALEVAHRDRPSVSWSPGQRALQLSLFH